VSFLNWGVFTPLEGCKNITDYTSTAITTAVESVVAIVKHIGLRGEIKIKYNYTGDYSIVNTAPRLQS